jgi:hypothetical protein
MTNDNANIAVMRQIHCNPLFNCMFEQKQNKPNVTRGPSASIQGYLTLRKTSNDFNPPPEAARVK